jgi:DNA-binding MarR family transcriptional regulator
MVNADQVALPQKLTPDRIQDLVIEARAFCHAFAKATERLEHSSHLLPAERDLLQTLASNGSQTVPQIARRRGTSRQNIQVLVNRLINDGAIALVDNPDHRTSSLIEITVTGQRWLSDVRLLESKLLAGIELGRSALEVAAATELLREIRSQLQRLVGAGHPPTGSTVRGAGSGSSKHLGQSTVPPPIAVTYTPEETVLPFNLL